MAALGLLTSLWIFTPWHGSLWNFNPEQVAKNETQMWRLYYEKNYLQLGWYLYASLRDQYHLSPWNAATIAWDLSRAARTFQKSRGRTEARLAIPLIENAYRRLAVVTGEDIDTRRAAALELEWWQQRRERATPEEYARTIAALAEVVYRCGPDPRLDAAALERAQAMRFRNERGKNITEADWKKIQSGLTRCYEAAHQVLMESRSAPPRDPRDPP